MSSGLSLWKHIPTNTYYVSRDFCEIIQPKVDYSYMLLYTPEPERESPYRQTLTNPKRVTQADFVARFIEYDNEIWQLRKIK